MQQRLPRPHVVSVTSRHITQGHQRQEHRIKMPNTSGAFQQGIQQWPELLQQSKSARTKLLGIAHAEEPRWSQAAMSLQCQAQAKLLTS